jgi:hypothetical protein
MTWFDKILKMSFQFGVIWFFSVMVVGAVGVPVTFGIAAISIPAMIIPKALWVWNIRPDPFD